MKTIIKLLKFALFACIGIPLLCVAFCGEACFRVIAGIITAAENVIQAASDIASEFFDSEDDDDESSPESDKQ